MERDIRLVSVVGKEVVGHDNREGAVLSKKAACKVMGECKNKYDLAKFLPGSKEI